MAAGERSLLLPSGSSTAITVTLGSFTPAPHFWDGTEDRWPAVMALKGRATALYGAGLLLPATRAFSVALRHAVIAGGPPPLPPSRAHPKADLHAGLALCQLRLGLPAAAAANAGKALALRPGHVKARYRRAMAAAAMMDWDGAAEDLGEVLRAEPGNRAARRELGVKVMGLGWGLEEPYG
uniref:FKBPL protein n=1 Tax=Pavo cristatus TaxID=9049 RepID=A0A8C9LDJ5_PAVCR